MHTNFLTKIIVIFATLTITGVGMIVLSQQSALEAVRTTLPLVGSAIFASALTFFLIQMTNYSQK